MRWCRRRSRVAVEYFVVVDGPVVLLSRFGGSLNVLEDWIIRVDFVVQHQPLGGQAQRFLHGELVLLRVSCQQLVLGLVELCLGHLPVHQTCNSAIRPLRTNRTSTILTLKVDARWFTCVRSRLLLAQRSSCRFCRIRTGPSG